MRCWSLVWLLPSLLVSGLNGGSVHALVSLQKFGDFFLEAFSTWDRPWWTTRSRVGVKPWIAGSTVVLDVAHRMLGSVADAESGRNQLPTRRRAGS